MTISLAANAEPETYVPLMWWWLPSSVTLVTRKLKWLASALLFDRMTTRALMVDVESSIKDNSALVLLPSKSVSRIEMRVTALKVELLNLR